MMGNPQILNSNNNYLMVEHFLKILHATDNYFGRVYYHLFSILDPKELEITLAYLKDVWSGKDKNYGEEGKEYWFTLFHKMIRQTDFFQGVYKRIELELMTKQEISEFWFLNDKVTKKGYDKSGDGNHLFNDEYRRYLELSRKKRSQIHEQALALGGHLDMMLWNLIHADTENVLQNMFIKFFERNENT